MCVRRHFTVSENDDDSPASSAAYSSSKDSASLLGGRLGRNASMIDKLATHFHVCVLEPDTLGHQVEETISTKHDLISSIFDVKSPLKD